MQYKRKVMPVIEDNNMIKLISVSDIHIFTHELDYFWGYESISFSY